MANWRKLWGLTWAERCSLLQALALLPSLALAVRIMGLIRTRAVLIRLSPVPSSPERAPAADEPRVRQVSRMVSAAACHGPYRANCLSRSLALWWLLRREGIPSDLRLGVRKAPGGIEAHAWLERDGRPLNDRHTVSLEYSPFAGAIYLGGTNAA
jgi:hypothetical protein